MGNEEMNRQELTADQVHKFALALFRQGVPPEAVLHDAVRAELEELHRGRSRLLRCKRAQERMLVRGRR